MAARPNSRGSHGGHRPRTAPASGLVTTSTLRKPVIGKSSSNSVFERLLQALAEQHEHDLAVASGKEGAHGAKIIPQEHQDQHHHRVLAPRRGGESPGSWIGPLVCRPSTASRPTTPADKQFQREPPGDYIGPLFCRAVDKEAATLHDAEGDKNELRSSCQDFPVKTQAEESSFQLPNQVEQQTPRPSSKPSSPPMTPRETMHQIAVDRNPTVKVKSRSSINKDPFKEKVSEKLTKFSITRSRVEPTGRFPMLSRFVTSSLFDKASAFLLITNAVFVGVQVECLFYYPDAVPAAIEMIDYVFCGCFVTELVMRIAGFGPWKYFWKNTFDDLAWNWFDFVIVTFSFLDAVLTAVLRGENSVLSSISVLRVIRVVRITRVLRVIRVLKFFRDLRIMLAAIAGTIKTACFAFILIFMAMYMWGIALTQMAAEHINGLKAEKKPVSEDMLFFFGSISSSIISLFMTVAGGIDWKDAYVCLTEIGVMAVFIYIVFVLLMTLCVMNVLVGIFCQCAIETAASDKETTIMAQLQEKQRFIDTLTHLFGGWDESGDGICSLEEFMKHLADDTMQALLRSLEIEVRDALTLFELLDADGTGNIDLEEFITGCITLRGGAKAVHMEKMNTMSKIVNQKLDSMDKKVHQLLLRSKARESHNETQVGPRPPSDHIPILGP